MQLVDDAVARTAEAVGESSMPEGAGDYLLCIAGDRSYPVRIPDGGELVIGRGPDVGLSLEDPLVSRTHAQVMRVPDGLRVADLDSRHGTLLNGEPLREPRLLGSGDVIGIGSTLLVVRRPARTVRSANLVERPALVRRLAEELARIASFERELSVLVFRHLDHTDPAELVRRIAQRTQAIDLVALLGASTIGVVVPECGADAAAEVARSVLGFEGVRAACGIATAPFDGIDADTMIGGARDAAFAGSVGEIKFADDVATTIEVGSHKIVLADPAMLGLYELAKRLARSTLPVLIEGETGVGKEVAAAAVHAYSQRATAPFVSINCAAIPESLAESELFGHARGSFSGAVATKQGQLETASGGTIFLDEIGELSPAIQAKLLRVLETGELVRVGEVNVRTTDLRIVAATNRDLEREAQSDGFRADLYFRLGVARLQIPPLRERPRDIAVVARRMLAAACTRIGRPPLALSIGAALALFRHDWPGNVRELRHAIEYAATAAPESATELELWHLPPPLAARARSARDGQPGPLPDAAVAPPPLEVSSPSGFRPIADEVRELERARMIAALRASNGVQNRAAELIEMPLRTFVTKLKRYGIVPSEWS